MIEKINRRRILKGTGASLALPALESLGFKANASAREKQPSTPPKRMIFLSFGFGVTNKTWYPSQNDQGTKYKLPEGLKPLAKHKKDFTLVQGCEHKYSRDAHWGSTMWLTGANRYGTPGVSFSNTISADQVAANMVGKYTRFSSIQLCSPDQGESEGHGPGLSLAWDKRGKPISGFTSPLETYLKLFSADEIPLEQRQAMLAEKRSILDSVHIEAKAMQNGLTKTDHNKLDEYFQSIRDIETSLSKTESWLDVPKSKTAMSQPDEGLLGAKEIEVMYKLIVAALQTDNTRVITYRQPLRRLLRSLDISANPHGMSHYQPNTETEAASKTRDQAQSKLLAGFLDLLKNTKEIDGTSLFDNVSLAYGSNIRSIHFLNNCPTILAGGAANIKLGHNLVLPEGTPLNNVWLTLLRGVGLPVKHHGDSTGVIEELKA